MIHIDLKPEPSDFDFRVRQPGRAFLVDTPKPNSKLWSKHNYWNRCSTQLYEAYGGICAYTGQWISNPGSAPSVDHFLLKSRHPDKAYEWDNYRLTTQTMNEYKKDKYILDPFEIQNGDIVIDFPSCLLRPRADMAPEEKDKVKATIQILRLNREEYAGLRCQIVMQYIDGRISKQFLQEKYPFIAEELERQNLYERIKEIVKSKSDD